MLEHADQMFPEGVGAPRATDTDRCKAPKTNELLENVKVAIDKLWKRRGYDPKKPAQTKARLGYALDKEEAVGYVVTGAMGLPRLAPDEARAIGKRVGSIVGVSGPVGSKLKALRKRGNCSAEISHLLQAPSTLSLAPPAPKGSKKRQLPEPLPQVPLQPVPSPPCATAAATSAGQQLCARSRAEFAAVTPLQKQFGIPGPGAWGADEDNVPDDPQFISPISPDGPSKALAHLLQWRHSAEAARAIIEVISLEGAYMQLDEQGVQGRADKWEVMLDIEVATVRYGIRARHA